MRNKFTTILISFLVLLLIVSLALAAGADTKKGKASFKANCRACHDGKTAKVPAFTPMTKTITMWEKAFKPGGAAQACVPRVKEKTGVALSAQDLADIGAYVIAHAADSDQPATCGS